MCNFPYVTSRQFQLPQQFCVCVCVCVYIYIYMMPEKANILQSISLRDLNHILCVFVVYPVCVCV